MIEQIAAGCSQVSLDIDRYFTVTQADWKWSHSIGFARFPRILPRTQIIMSRTAIIATGFLCIMLGAQLYLVESFTLTPRMSHFLTDNFSDASETPIVSSDGNEPQFTQPRQAYNSSYYQASFGQNGSPQVATTAVGPRGNAESTVRPPRWVIWPVMFLGAFLILQGASRPK